MFPLQMLFMRPKAHAQNKCFAQSQKYYGLYHKIDRPSKVNAYASLKEQHLYSSFEQCEWIVFAYSKKNKNTVTHAQISSSAY